MRVTIGFAAAALAALPPAVDAATQGKSPDRPSRAAAEGPDAPLPPYHGPRKRAVVTAMEVKVQGVTTTAPTVSGNTTVVTLDIQQPTEFGTGLSDMLTTALVASRRFVVLERGNFEEIQKERERGKGEDFDPATLARTGRLLGAQVIVRGAVTELSFRKSGSGVDGIVGDLVSASKARSEAMVAIDLKMVDVETGEVLDSVRAEGRAVSTQTSVNLTSREIKIGNATFDNGPIGKALRTAIENAVRAICERSGKRPWESRIAEVVEEDDRWQVFVAASRDQGLQTGDLLDVHQPGVELRDPDTLQVLGRSKGKRVGRLQVVSVEDRFAVATVLEGSGFAKAQVVRFAERPGTAQRP